MEPNGPLLPFWPGLCEQVAKKVLTEEVSPVLLAMVEPPFLSWNLCVFCVFFSGREGENIMKTRWWIRIFFYFHPYLGK